MIANSKTSMTGADVVIISYDLLSRRKQELEKIHFQCIIADERWYPHPLVRVPGSFVLFLSSLDLLLGVDLWIPLPLVSRNGAACTGCKICESRSRGNVADHPFMSPVIHRSHYIKNHAALRTKVLLPVLKVGHPPKNVVLIIADMFSFTFTPFMGLLSPQCARRSILLTGTPALARPIELFTQAHALQPTIFKNRHSFAQRYCDRKQGPFGVDDTGASCLTELHLLLEVHFCVLCWLFSVAPWGPCAVLIFVSLPIVSFRKCS